MPTPDELLSRLRAVTGPELTPPLPVSPWPWWIAVALVAMLMGGIVLFWPRRRMAAALPPDEEARRALDSLAAAPDGEALGALDRLARTFLGRRHGVDAERLTTPELLAALPDEIAARWSEVLLPCDHARYSGMLPTQAAYAAMVRSAATLIQAAT